MTDRWVILRMASMSTLPVAAALTDAGFTVWTPVETIKRRSPRSKVAKSITMPITPGIVFADDAQLHDLVMLARSPSLTSQRWNPETKRMETRGCPYFSIFRYQGKYPRIADRHLDPLRMAAQGQRLKSKVVPFKVGDEVRSPEGPTAGMTGRVVEVRGKKAFVLFNEGWSSPWEIPIAHLLPLANAA